MKEYALIKVIENFIHICDSLFMEGKITETQYRELTKYRKEFLHSFS